MNALKPTQGGTPLAGWEVVSAAVPLPLRPFIASWVGYREWSSIPVRRREHPTGRAVLVFEFGPSLGIVDAGDATQRYPGGFFAGIDDGPSLTEFVDSQAGVQVVLTPLGAHAFVGAPMETVARRVVALSDLGVARAVSAQLAEATSWGARFEMVATALQVRLAQAPGPSTAVGWALARIDASHGALSIASLGEALGYSRKHLHARFVREVGLSPKRYARIRRFERLRRSLASSPSTNLATLALDLGYADQSHMARDVRRFSGVTTSVLWQSLRDPLADAIRALAED